MSTVNCITIKQNDGYITNLYYMSCGIRPKASILILHGMAEHHKRYKPFAKYLVNNGFDVYLYDHRGHGTDKKLNELGFLIIRAISLLLMMQLQSVIILQIIIKVKSSFIRHSMGSLIARNIIQSYDKYNGVILSGTAYPPKILIFWIIMTSLVKRLKDQNIILPI